MLVSDFFKWALNKFMKKSVYDANGNGIVNKAEKLNDGTSGGGNEVTASEARSHIDNTEKHRIMNFNGCLKMWIIHE